MAITQPIGNVRVMPQVPDTGDPLAGMKAFAVGTQLGQELAGLSLASEKLKFEKAKLKAQEQGLQWEQMLAQFKLKAAQDEAQRQQALTASQIEENKARAALTDVERQVKERELALSRVDLTGAASALLGDASVPVAEEPAVESVLADAEVGAAAPQEFKVPQLPEVGKAAPAAAPAPVTRYQPTFASADRNPEMSLGSATPYETALAAEREQGRREAEALVRQIAVTQLTSPAEARKMLPQAAALREKIATSRPTQGFLDAVDDRGVPLKYPVYMDSTGKPVSVAGAPRVDVEALHKQNVAAKELDTAFAKDFGAAIGAAPKTAENIKTLEAAEQMLTSSDVVTGPLISLIPQAVRARIPGLREGVKAQAAVEQVTAQSLREILGGQFAAIEGENLLKRAFDVRMDEAENVRRLKALLATVKSGAEAMGAAREYFKTNGTLFGYDGPSPSEVRDRIAAELQGAASFGRSATPASEPASVAEARRKVAQAFERSFTPANSP